MTRPSYILAALALAAALLSACGADSETTATDPAPAATVAEPEGKPARRAPETVEPARCPPEAGAGCRETEGRIVFVERVDPDGDGDAHFVVADSGSITLPGLTAIDVRRGLRPHPLPGYGELISAAGPVQTGSHGQSQIHALEINVGKAGD